MVLPVRLYPIFKQAVREGNVERVRELLTKEDTNVDIQVEPQRKRNVSIHQNALFIYPGVNIVNFVHLL